MWTTITLSEEELKAMLCKAYEQGAHDMEPEDSLFCTYVPYTGDVYDIKRRDEVVALIIGECE